MRKARNTVRLVVIGAILACALNGQGAQYAGWAVGVPSGDQPTILRSTDSGGSWTRQGIGQVAAVPMFGVVAVDPYTAWVVGLADAAGYATIYHTTNGGLLWNRMGSAAQVPNVGLQKVATFGDNLIWAVGSGVILHSGDGGATWTNQVPADYASIQFQGVSTPDGVNVWVTGNAVGGYATILKSSDGGMSWTRQNGSADDVQLLNHILDISAVNSNTVWAIGGVNTSIGWYVLSTTNGGVTWTQENQGTYDGNGICAVDASTIWAVSDHNTTWSTNGGATWTVTQSPTDTLGISAVDARQAWAVSAAQSGAIQWTTNGGLTWVTQTQLDGETLPALFTVSFASTPIPKPPSAANLLTNGDFEIEPNWGGGVSHDAGYTALIGSQLPGWTIEPNRAVTIHISPGSYLVISNAYSANTDGEGYNGHNASFYQDFGSTPGAYYVLSFDWQSWGFETTPTTSQLKISVVDTVTSAVLFNGLYSYDGNGAHPVHHTATNFFGSGATSRLRIEESPESGYNDNTFVVDNFSVTEGLPLLRVTQSSPSQAILTWPTNTAGFVLETAPALPASTWMTMTNVPVVGNNRLFNLAVSTTNAQQFFRLQHP